MSIGIRSIPRIFEKVLRRIMYLALFFSAAGVLTGGMVVRNLPKPAGGDTGGTKNL
jgi:hypothetical protein